ncbi:isocitrate lyase/PEP mutase family protein [Sphingobium nicotianae]|uniref:Isocitrate lyase/PEP mutase family protein n=1 Tax=Sphingobium nicotianae TaxID=2782607 RepID=A0A9X1DGA2_9SPHN|nr:isocitrate lyase/phosphoenolpyruvate mutase family protein [Sphingobium nicotianae]MBT2189351.1 isocitrate lyase/PEP mutase family protein [Sphingobium nicotianae]
MSAQAERYERFRALHERPGAFIMPNAWDALSAALLAREGFEALGSTSAAIAFALGRQDGAHAVSRAEAIDNAVLLGAASGLPINGDLEDGFGPDPDDCVATVEAAIAAGLAGLGIEDTTANRANPIHGFDTAVARIAAAAKAANGRILLTARADNFINGRPDLDDTIRRLTAFAEAGADVLYAPGLPSLEAIEAVVRAVAPKPVNVLIGPGDLATLSALGVKRISMGGALQRRAYDGLIDAAQALQAGNMADAGARLGHGEVMALFAK